MLVCVAGREMTRLAGLTARLDQFISVLDDVHRGHYVRTMVNQQQEAAGQGNEDGKAKVQAAGSGRVITEDNIIRFEHVPLVTPNGDCLVPELNFEVRSGNNVIVCGPNGCGKSSLFRILAGLWPLFGGVLTKPDPSKLFYIPQRPYMPLGTLRDQILYPHTHALAQSYGTTDQQLAELLERVQLGYILEREGGFDAVRDWMDTLSGGEKQRIAMARLFYHKPQFAILDECTSAVSIDVESFIYEHCRRAGITLFTVSHRKSLWKHHEYYLFMDGRGKFEFAPITSETNVFGS